jgi:hypothetical protein
MNTAAAIRLATPELLVYVQHRNIPLSAARYYTCRMSKHLESLYQNLLYGKLAHNLSWSEAVELVEHLGEVQPHGDDEFVFRVGPQRVFFKRPHTHDLDRA